MVGRDNSQEAETGPGLQARGAGAGGQDRRRRRSHTEFSGSSGRQATWVRSPANSHRVTWLNRGTFLTRSPEDGAAEPLREVRPSSHAGACGPPGKGVQRAGHV